MDALSGVVVVIVGVFLLLLMPAVPMVLCNMSFSLVWMCRPEDMLFGGLVEFSWVV